MTRCRSLKEGAVAAVAVLVMAGCGAGFEIGPIELTIDLGDGQLAAVDFGGVSRLVAIDATVTQPLCDLPTEEDLQSALQDAVPGINISRIVSLSRIEVAGIALDASQGDFSSITAMELAFIPKPVSGVPQAPVLFGSVATPPALGTEIVLSPPQTVDMLELVRANDANAEAACPEAEFSVSGTPPAQTVQWEGTMTVKVWAKIGA